MPLVAHPRAFGEVHRLESHPARLSHHAGPEPQKAPGLVDGDVGALRLLHAALALLPEAELASRMLTHARTSSWRRTRTMISSDADRRRNRQTARPRA